MTITDKPSRFGELVHTDLSRLSAEQLQDWLDAYFAQHDITTAQQLVQELVIELQAHRAELKRQNHNLLESQRKLEEERDRYVDFYDIAPVGYISFDSTGCIRDINLTGATMLGQDRSQLLGKPFDLYLAKPSQQLFLSYLNAVNQSQKVLTQELQLEPANGDKLEVQLETIINPGSIGSKPSYRCVVIDITRRKLAEREVLHQAQQIRTITDSIPAYIAYIDRTEHYQFANKAYKAWFNYPSEKFIGKTVKEVIGEKLYARVGHHIHLALNGTPVNFEWTVANPDNVEHVINTSYIPDNTEDGSVLGYFVMSRDVTELRQLEALDKIHLLEMARVSRINTMGEMVAELAHELNQPLAAITIYSDAVNRMLDKGKKDVPEMQKALDEIRFQAERAGEVIRRLREFVSKRELLSEQVELNELVQEVMNLVSVEARWHDCQLVLALGENIPPVEVDRVLIEQVILNLARNAIEAMDVNEPDNRQLVIKTGIANHDEVELAVEDTGPGLGADELNRIFEPFYTTKTHGMGMGLAISRSIIKEHHGHIWAIVNEGGGMTFTFTLPRFFQR